jgi:predicted amidophosphoribosyltransferase
MSSFTITEVFDVATKIDIVCSQCKKEQPLASECCNCGKKLDGIYIPKNLKCFVQVENNNEIEGDFEDQFDNCYGRDEEGRII